MKKGYMYMHYLTPLILLVGCGSAVNSIESSLQSRDYPGACLQEEKGRFETAYGGCYQVAANTVWSSTSTTRMTYREAVDRCERLEEGHIRWWLPTREQLESLKAENGSSHIYGTYDYFWSAKDATEESTWLVDLEDGYESERLSLADGRPNFVICARKSSEVLLRDKVNQGELPRAVKDLPVGTRLYLNKDLAPVGRHKDMIRSGLYLISLFAGNERTFNQGETIRLARSIPDNGSAHRAFTLKFARQRDHTSDLIIFPSESLVENIERDSNGALTLIKPDP